MTFDERVNAVAGFGFSERQARFLVHVLLFGGMCVPRQYATFAGTAYGQKVNAFFAKLVQRGYATDCRCIHNRARLYHVHHRPLYEAIGEPRSRYRLAVPVGRAIERLIRLDAVLHHAHLRWLITDADKVRFVARVAPSFPRERLPHVAVGIGARRRLRMFPDDVLIGVDATNAPLFVCVVTTPYEEELVGVFQRHGDLLGALPRWTFRLMFPPHLAIGMGRYQVAFRGAIAEPYSSRIVDEMRWYFEQLKLASATRRYPEDEPRFREDQYAFATPRCRALYRRWLTDGEAAFDVASSHAIVEHLGNETGHVECERLPVSYRHLSPVVSPGRSTPAGVEEGVEQGAEEGEQTSARPQPSVADNDETTAARCAHDWQRLVDARKPLSLQ